MLYALDCMLVVIAEPITISEYDVISSSVFNSIWPFSVTYGTPSCFTVPSRVPFTYNSITVLLNLAVRCVHESSGISE